MPITALAVGAGGSVVGGVLNYLATSSANDRAEKIQNENFQKWLQLNVPDP